MKLLRIIILFANLALFLALANWGIWSAENNIANGRLAYFALAPVDPRSLIQGDYMMLNYEIENQARVSRSNGNFERNGFIVVQLDNQQIARFVRVYTEGEILAEGEMLIKYASPFGWSVDIGIDSFFFQEGLSDIYAEAEYAEVRILDDGSVAIIDLRNANLGSLLPNS